jgi:hypothetical protein
VRKRLIIRHCPEATVILLPFFEAFSAILLEQQRPQSASVN